MATEEFNGELTISLDAAAGLYPSSSLFPGVDVFPESGTGDEGSGTLVLRQPDESLDLDG